MPIAGGTSHPAASPEPISFGRTSMTSQSDALPIQSDKVFGDSFGL